MPEIIVAQGFTLQLDDGTKRVFTPGRHDVDEATASHWFVAPHLFREPEPEPEPPPPPVSAEAHAAALARVAELEAMVAAFEDELAKFQSGAETSDQMAANLQDSAAKKGRGAK